MRIKRQSSQARSAPTLAAAQANRLEGTPLPKFTKSQQKFRTQFFSKAVTNKSRGWGVTRQVNPLAPQKVTPGTAKLVRHSPTPVVSRSSSIVLPIRLNASAVRGVPIVIVAGKGYVPSSAFGVNSAVGIRGAGGGGLCAGCPPGAANDAFGAIQSLIAGQLDMVREHTYLFTTVFLASDVILMSLQSDFTYRNYPGTVKQP